MDEIGRPISPSDEQLDYVPTQVVAEYLLHHHPLPSEGKPGRIEAVIYRSAQNPKGRNIAVLGDAARVGVLEADKPATKGPNVGMPTAEDRWLAKFGGPEKFRIAAKPASLETRRVTGATYASTPHTNACWPDGDEAL